MHYSKRASPISGAGFHPYDLQDSLRVSSRIAENLTLDNGTCGFPHRVREAFPSAISCTYLPRYRIVARHPIYVCALQIANCKFAEPINIGVGRFRGGRIRTRCGPFESIDTEEKSPGRYTMHLRNITSPWKLFGMWYEGMEVIINHHGWLNAVDMISIDKILPKMKKVLEDNNKL